MLSSFSSAQETILGNVAFYPSGAARSIESNSSIGLGTQQQTNCAQAPIWHDADIQKGQNPTIYNTTFGPCAVDGVLVRDLVLTRDEQGHYPYHSTHRRQVFFPDAQQFRRYPPCGSHRGRLQGPVQVEQYCWVQRDRNVTAVKHAG